VDLHNTDVINWFWIVFCVLFWTASSVFNVIRSQETETTACVSEIAWEGVYRVDVGQDMRMWRTCVHGSSSCCSINKGNSWLLSGLFPFREGLCSMLGWLPSLWQVLMFRCDTDG
jgi:hypothetical protein